MKKSGLGAHYVAHDSALFYENAGGVPWTAAYIQAKGDPIADLYEDIEAEENAPATYQYDGYGKVGYTKLKWVVLTIK